MLIPYEMILKKQHGEAHTPEELQAFIQGAVDGDIMEAQLAAWMMAVYFKGMTVQETADLTEAMIDTGERIRFENLGMPIGDKHSTGGVGDKITLMLAPLVAACGVAVPTVTGRGLGFTGGTLDKLEAIPGFRTDLSIDQLKTMVREHDLAFGAQTKSLAPADKLMYSLRDVTATIRSLPLITSSILSKKIAEGIDAIVFDVKCGKGAFMETEEEARELGQRLVQTADAFGLHAAALITSMNEPLGHAVGNWLESEESLFYLRGEAAAQDLHELVLGLGGTLLHLTGKADSIPAGIRQVKDVLHSGEGYRKFCEVAIAQGADPNALEAGADPYPPAEMLPVKAPSDGYIHEIHAREIGYACISLGAGRRKADDVIDPTAGMVLDAKVGAAVNKGDTMARIFAKDQATCEKAVSRFEEAFVVKPEPVEPTRLIRALVTQEGIQTWNYASDSDHLK